MSKLRCHISISLDGFVAGPHQSEENPLGEGGEWVHDWMVPLAASRRAHGEQGGEVNESARIVEESGGRPAKTSCSRAAPTSLSSPWHRDCSTNLSSTSSRCCSATVLASSTISGTRRCSLSRSGPSMRPASRTSSTEW